MHEVTARLRSAQQSFWILPVVAIGGDLLRVGLPRLRRDAASRPSFAVRLLELLAELRESAPSARSCREIDRQAELIAEQATEVAGHEADQRMVTDAYSRLHGHARTHH